MRKTGKIILLFICLFCIGFSLSFPIFDNKSFLQHILSDTEPISPVGNWVDGDWFTHSIFVNGGFIKTEVNHTRAWYDFFHHGSWGLWFQQGNTWINKTNLMEFYWKDNLQSHRGFGLNLTPDAQGLWMLQYTLDYSCKSYSVLNNVITMYFNGWVFTMDWNDLVGLANTQFSYYVNDKDQLVFNISRNVPRLGVGRKINLDPTYGIIADNGIQTYEYDGQEGHYVDSIKVGSDDEYSYFAIVSTGDTGSENDGYVRTVKVNESTGAITNSLVDYLEYDTSDGFGPSICQVGSGMYAIAYCDAGASKITVKTVSISSVGVVGNAVTETQTLTNDGIDASSMSHIMHLTGDIYVVAYTDVNGDGWLETLDIDGAGVIADAVLDSEEFDEADGYFPRMALVDIDTVAVIYETTDTGAGSATARDGMLKTYNISDAGIITDTPADSYEYDTDLGRWPGIISVGGGVFVLAHEGTGNDGFVRSISIDSGGDIGALIDFIEFDTNDGGFQTLYNLSRNSVADRYVYAVTYQGNGGDGFIKTFTVDGNGNMPLTVAVDSLEYDTADTLWYAQLLPVSGFRWLIAHVGTGNDGFVRTTQIYINDPASIDDEYPVDTSVDVPVLPTLSFNVSDYGDELDVSWWSNSSGSWAEFGNNNSVTSFGAISDSNIDNYEWDAEEGKARGRIGVVRLNDSEYYATVACGDTGGDNDGFLRTLRVWNNNGTIQKSVIEKWEFDASDGDWANIQHIPGTDKYVIAYRDVANTRTEVITVKISDVDGDITTSAIDTLQLTNDGQKLHMIPLTDNIYVISYKTPTADDDGWFETIWVNSSGTINDTVLDTEEFDAVFAENPSLCKIDDNTIALSYVSTSLTGDYTLMTYDIDSSGLITDAPTDSWVYEASPLAFAGVFAPQDINKISGTIYSITYIQVTPNIYTKTLSITDAGVITKSWVATNKIVYSYEPNMYTFMALDPDDASDGVGVMGMAGCGDESGYNYDGWMYVWTVDTAGKLGPGQTDSLEFDTTSCFQLGCVYVLHVADDYFFVVYSDGDGDGRSCTVKIGLDNPKTLTQTNSNFSASGTKYWWSVNVSDGIQWTNQTFSFTTLASAENRNPSVNASYPTNGSTGISVNIDRHNITINDPDGDLMNYTYRYFIEGCGLSGDNAVAVGNGTYSLILNSGVCCPLDYDTTYTWWVNVTDGYGGYDNETFSFTTESESRTWTNLFNGYLNGGNNTVDWHELFSGHLNGGNDTIVWRDLFSGYLTGGNNTLRLWYTLFNGYLTSGNDTVDWQELLNGYLQGGNDTITWHEIFSGYLTGGNISLKIWHELFSGYLNGGNDTIVWRDLFSGYLTGGNDTVSWQELFSGYLAGGNESSRIWQELLNGYLNSGNNTVTWNTLFNGYLSGGNISTFHQMFTGYLTGGNTTVNWNNLLDGYLNGGNDTIVWQDLFTGYLTGGNNTVTWNTLFNGYLNGGNNTSRIWVSLLDGYLIGGNNSIVWNNIFSGYLNGGNNTVVWHELFNGYLQGGNVSPKTWNNLFTGYLTGGNIPTGWNQLFNGYLNGGNNTVILHELLNGYLTGGNNSYGISITSFYPLNESLDIPVNVTLQLIIYHTNGTQMNITWYRNNGSIYLGSHNNIGNGTYMMFSNANTTNTTYWWSFNITDGTTWYNSTQWFKTSSYISTGGIPFFISTSGDHFLIGLLIGILIFTPIILIMSRRRKK